MIKKRKIYTFAQKLFLKLAVLLASMPSVKAYGENHCAGNWIHWSPGASMTPPCLVFTNGLTGTNVAYNRAKCKMNQMTGNIDYAYKQNLD